MLNKYVIFGLAVTIVAAFMAPQFLGKDDTHQILAHFEVRDMEQLPAYGFDAFVYGHQGFHEDVVDSLIEAGKLSLRYYNVLTYPLPEWLDGDNVWFNFFWYQYGQRGANFFDFHKRQFGYFPWYGKPLLVNWSKIDSAKAQRIVDFQYSLSPQGVFLDQTWRRPQPWMFDPTRGASYEAFPDSVYDLWQTNFEWYIRLCREKFGPSHVLLNGDDTFPAPVYLEHSEWAWEPSKTIWAADKRNVLSVDAQFPQWVDTAIDEWRRGGGWIAFTGNDSSKVTAAYTQAGSVRK